MKKVLIISGIILVIIVTLLWIYFLIFGQPRSAAEIFATFITDDTVVQPTIVSDEDTPVEIDVISRERLKQLTLRPVAGYTFSNNDQIIRYVEQGTGHIYEINLNTGSEERIAAETYGKIITAYFSSSSDQVLLVKEDRQNRSILLNTITSSNEVSSTDLPRNIENITFSHTGDAVYFTEEVGAETIAYSYDLTDGSVSARFSIPFVEAVVIWESEDTPVYVYQKPSREADGYIYKVTDVGELEFITTGFPGLEAFITSAGLMLTGYHEDAYESYIRLNFIGELPVAIPAVPSKCTQGREVEILWCSFPAQQVLGMPDDWYSGKITLPDILWEIKITSGAGVAVIDFESESGRRIDAINLIPNTDSTQLLFSNKNDRTLWLYDDTVE